MEPYDVLIHGAYSNERCYEAFFKLKSSPKDPDLIVEAIESALPVLGKVLRNRFRKIRPYSQMYDEILERVPHAFYMLLISDSFYEKFYLNKSNHFAYLWAMFRYEILNALNAFRRAHRWGYGYDAAAHFRVANLPAALEMTIYAGQFRSAVLTDAKKAIRFLEEPAYTVCLTALEALVAGKPIPWYVIKELAEDSCLSELEFLVDHARVLVRRAVLCRRKEFEQLQSQLSYEFTLVRDSVRESVPHTELNDVSDEMPPELPPDVLPEEVEPELEYEEAAVG